MNYYFTGILIILLCLMAFIGPAYPDTTQNNTSGSNTSITGDCLLFGILVKRDILAFGNFLLIR